MVILIPNPIHFNPNFNSESDHKPHTCSMEAYKWLHIHVSLMFYSCTIKLLGCFEVWEKSTSQGQQRVRFESGLFISIRKSELKTKQVINSTHLHIPNCRSKYNWISIRSRFFTNTCWQKCYLAHIFLLYN